MAINIPAWAINEANFAAVGPSFAKDMAALSPGSPAELTPFVNAVVAAMARALEEVKDNADVVGVTSGSDTVAGGVD